MQINIMPCEGARIAWEAWTIGEVCSKSLQHREGSSQVFYTAERGYHPMVLFSVRCSFVSVKARWIGYVGDG